MKNIERITKKLIKQPNSVQIQTIYGTPYWITAEKTNDNKWLLKIVDPLSTVEYNVDIVDTITKKYIWKQLVYREVNEKTTLIQLSKEVKEKISHFLQSKTYKKFLDIK